MEKKWNYSDHSIIGNELYYVCDTSIICVEMTDWKAKYIENVQNRNWLFEHGVSTQIVIGGKLFFISWYPMAISMYDLQANSILPVYEGMGEASIFNIEIWNNEAYIFRRNANEVIILDDKGKYKVLQYDLPGLKKNMRNIRVGGEMFFFPDVGDVYYSYELETGRLHRKHNPIKLLNCSDVATNGEKIVFLDKEEIVEWNIKKCSVNKMKLVVDSSFELSGKLVLGREKVIVLPRLGEDIFLISKEGVVEKYNNYPLDYYITQSKEWLIVASKYLKGEEKNGVLYYPRRATNYMLTIDSNDQISWIAIKDPSVEEVTNQELHEGIIKERDGSLRLYLNQICKK